jgi:mannosyltransferase OCH1-like enzyme
MIPKKIHYCWYGNNPKNELIVRCMDTWRSKLHDYEIIEWNESNSPLDIPYCKSALEKQLWSKVANYVRLWAVYNEGGIYLDTDFEILKSLDSFLHHDCFVAFQRIEEKPGWVTNGIFGAVEGNAFVKLCMEKTIGIFESQQVFEISSRMTTMVLKEMGLTSYGYQEIDGVAIYPADYFYPYSWVEDFDPSCIKETTHAMHHWNKSWVKPKK